MDLALKGKLALVSGSTAGIGHAIAAALAGEGARVIINGRTQKAVDGAVKELSAMTGGEVLGFAGDLSVASVAEDLARKHPGVEILVNNLGIFEAKPFEEIPDDDWRRFFDVNVLSGVRLAQLYLPAMKRANWGRIIFISSESGIQIPAEMIHYGMTKVGTDRRRTRARQDRWPVRASQSIRFCRGRRVRAASTISWTASPSRAVLPSSNSRNSSSRQVRPTSLIKRFATPEEVASLVAYVASPVSSATTGAALRVDGGVVKSAF